MMNDYPFRDIEPKWQKYWEENKTFCSSENPAIPKEKRRYVLDMFPYPSGAGLHVGHPEGYTATDIYCRYLRMNGYHVLHPMGFDSFGLPAENFAIKTGAPPRETTEKNIQNFIRQIKSLGFSYDWDREVRTHSPEYYRWTQWIFLKLYDKGLAYESEMPINWCPHCLTGLANEEVKEGKCERCGQLVERRNLRQWMLKITAYADRLLDDLDSLDWPASIKAMQKHWIGRSQGATVHFALSGVHAPLGDIKVYSTRPDTLYGTTYIVLSPEHPLVVKISSAAQESAVTEYREKARHKSDLERSDLSKEKTGVFTGAYASNPFNGKEIPVWIADYVLLSYGTGAIMAVPAHDQRDWEFAQKFHLPIIDVLSDDAGTDSSKGAFTGDGAHKNSGFLDGMNKTDAIAASIAKLKADNKGYATVNYKLRDWIFSRQRYWGEPIPLIHCSQCGTVTVPENQLPLLLPKIKSYHPSEDGESPLAKIESWVNTDCPCCQGPAKRETNTMPQWAGSCWYYLRYLDPENKTAFVSPEKESYWMPVNLYIGGAEHAVLHLLYARFWHKVLFDLKLVSHQEPFEKLVNQGMITSFAYMRPNKTLVPADEVEQQGHIYTEKSNGEPVQQVTAKMSKSLKNVINPDDIVQNYGADSMRLYEMFMGPLEVSMPWQTKGLIGVQRFLKRVWDISNRPLNDNSPPIELFKTLHKTLKKTGEDSKKLAFNTAIAQMMILVNEAYKEKYCWRQIWEPFTLILSPFAPHLGEEIWAHLGHKDSLAYETWPTWDEQMTIDEQKEIVLQINGKIRAKIQVSTGSEKSYIEKLANENLIIQEKLKNKKILKIISVVDRLVNFVVK